MNTSVILDWLLRTSWQASILVALVLAVQWLFRRRLNARWQYALWLLVVARLAMPPLPASSWSVFNVVHFARATTAPQPTASDVARQTASPPVTSLETEVAPIPESPAHIRMQAPRAVPSVMFDKQRMMRNAAIVWLAGLLVLAGRAIGQNIIFVRRLRAARAVTNGKMLMLFAQCQEIMGVSRPVLLAETEHVKSPALYGMFRPTLLLPLEVIQQFGADEQRHIFLHELAHIKRRDMAVHWVATVFRLLHWFNPVLWFGFQRMAADRELAADELALARAGGDESRAYGETVLKLLEICASPAALPGLMGILEEKSQMARRILMIARHRQQAHWPILALALIIGLGLVTFTDAQTEKLKPQPTAAASTSKPDLTGEVRMTGGQPVMATVFIATAGPKVGTSPFCPSCYADCIKSAKADAQGRFKIESLDPDLIFRILVVAKNCKPKYVGKVDPAKGPVTVQLESQNYADAPPGNTLRGRVVDGQGRPIVGAAVESFGIHKKDGTGMWGALKGVDPLAVTDERGDFLITSRDPFLAMDVKVDARTFAKRTFIQLLSGTTRHDLTMTEGAEVSGRVMWNGKPLPGVSVGVVSTDRTAEHFTGNYEVGTDADGQFDFINLPPNVQYNLYGIMQTLQNYGAVMSSQVATAGDGSKVNTGDLVVGRAQRLAGRVVLDDGSSVPANTRLMVGRETAWDSLQIVLDQDGHFDTAGIPSDMVRLNVSVPGYHVSAKNASLDTLNPYSLCGLVDKDITNLVLLMEKGPYPQPNYDSPPVEAPMGPLRGTEGGPRPQEARSRNWQISGRVTDGKTGGPVASFQVTPGNKAYRQIALEPRNRVEGSNGVYAVELSKRFAQAVFKVEAAGYLPAAVTPPQGDTTNFDITLQPGEGPAGTVMLPDGTPAANVTVGLICDGQQGIAIRDSKLQTWRAKSLVRTTDFDGHFSFAPELQMESVAAASAEGFALVSLTGLAANPKMILQPWGRVQGTLQRPSGPGTNEDLDLEFSPELVHERFSLDAGNHTITDETGHFDFDRVPPGKLDLTYRVKVGPDGRGWNSVPLQSITISPGQTLALKINAPDRAKPDRQFGVPQPKPERKLGPAISGTVVLPDGRPAAGVQVAILAPNEYERLGKGSLQTGRDTSLRTVTDDAGHFTLPGVEGAKGIVAVSETGFARVALPDMNLRALTLQPWGEIHGTLRIGRHLGANQSVVLAQIPGDGLKYDFNEFKATTDDRGHFVITYAPPGEQLIDRLVPTIGGGWTYSTPTTVNVKPGGVTEVSIGGTGREVIGKAVFQEPQDALDWKEVQFALRSVPASESGSVRPDSRSRFYYAESVTNGSFVVEDVPPGAYILSAQARRDPKEPQIINNRFANIQTLGAKDVTISDAGTGHENEPCDVGTLNLRTVHSLNVGDPATPVAAETPEGRKFQLADYRGKFVLLNILFEGVELPSDLPQLKGAFEAYGKDDRLTMLSVSYAPAKLLKELARTNGITWTHGSVGNRYSHTEFEDYVPFPPDQTESQLTYLIDPDGKIAAKDLHGAAINEAVAKALAKK